MRFDWGGLMLFVGFAVVAIAARRNVAIFAIGVALFIARSLAIVIDASPRVRRLTTRSELAVGVLVISAATLLSAAEVTGVLNRWDRQPREFGAGVIDGTFPVRAVGFARAASLPGKLYNDMSAGGYLSWDDPIGDGVFVDGRLEVYDTPFLTDVAIATSDPIRWQVDADRYGIQTVILFHRFENERVVVGRLAQSKVWSLVYVDEVAVIFVRTQGNDAALARAGALRPQWDAQTADWLAAPVAKWSYPAGRVEAMRAYARVLATTGRADAAVAAYMKFLELGAPAADEIDVRLLLARFFTSRGRQQEARDQAYRILAIDAHHAQALALVQ